MKDLKRLQRKLIPVNIIVMILSLVAAFSIIFAPLITVNIGEIAGSLIQQESGDEESGGEESQNSPDYMGAILDSFGDMKFSLTTYGLAKFAFSENPMGKITESIAKEIKKVENNLFANVAVELIPTLIASNENLDIDAENIDVKAVLNKFNDVLYAKTDEQVDQSIGALIDEIQKQAVSKEGDKYITDDMKGEIQDVVRQLYDNTKEALGDEKLTLESFICVTVSKILNGDGLPSTTSARSVAQVINDVDGEDEGENSNSGSGKIYTNYQDLINGMLGTSESADADAALDGLNEILDIVASIAKYFAIVMFFFAGIWIIQFLFAFFHLFAKNKRFVMWYTKLWGIYPCLLFGVAPLVVGKALSSMLPASFAGIFGAISSLTWISGACYLLLWVISIFWAFPIKRKIRRLLKSGATYNNDDE